uniref:Uncharacterized protein n=1 Tax=Kalanchoe fedtschenkoi TaxID=63787 RepID=A0A7N0U4I5_KALFE
MPKPEPYDPTLIHCLSRCQSTSSLTQILVGAPKILLDKSHFLNFMSCHTNHKSNEQWSSILFQMTIKISVGLQILLIFQHETKTVYRNLAAWNLNPFVSLFTSVANSLLYIYISPRLHTFVPPTMTSITPFNFSVARKMTAPAILINPSAVMSTTGCRCTFYYRIADNLLKQEGCT